jgi:hypothetical protein
MTLPASSRRADTFKLRDAMLRADGQQPWERPDTGYTPDPAIPSMMCKQELRFLHYIAALLQR